MSDETVETTGAEETATEELPTQTIIGETSEGEAATTPEAEAVETTEDVKEVVPEAYADFSMSEGVTVAPEALDAFKGLAKDMGLSQEKAQGLLDRYQNEIMPKIMASQMEVWTQDVQGRQSAIASDKEIGGDHLKTTSETVNRVVNTYLNKEEAAELAEYTGKFGDHPVMLKLLARIGKSIAEDKLVGSNSQSSGVKTEEDKYRALYPTMFK